jgi:hypothetical protein
MSTPACSVAELPGPTEPVGAFSTIQPDALAAVYVNVPVPELLTVNDCSDGFGIPCLPWKVNDKGAAPILTYPSRPNMLTRLLPMAVTNSLPSAPRAIPFGIDIGSEGS